MNLLLLITDSPTVATGFGTVAKALSPYLHEYRHHIDQLAVYMIGNEPILVDSVRLHPVHEDDSMGLRRLGDLVALQPSVVLLIHELVYCGVWAGRLRSLGYRGPIVGYFPVYGPILSPKERTALALMERRACFTHYGARVIKDHGYPCEGIHLGVDHGIFAPPTQERKACLAEKFGWEGKFVVIYVARNRWNKQQPKLLRAARIMMDAGNQDIIFYLHCVPNRSVPHWIPGMGSVHQEWDLLSLRESLDLGDVVEFPQDMRQQTLGVKQRDLVARMQAAHCVAHVAHGEGFGLPLVEAMGCGLPVMCTADGRAMEELLGSAGWFVDSSRELEDAAGNRFKDVTAKEWAESLIRLRMALSDPEQRKCLRRLSRERSKAFDWKKTAEELQVVLQAAESEERSLWRRG